MHQHTPILNSWHEFMEEIPAPVSFIEMAFFGMISAALQRRVYLGSEQWAVFPNMFVVLVGPPASGKGLAIFPTKDVITSFKKKDLVLKTPVVSHAKEGAPLPSIEDQMEAVEALTREFVTTNPGVKLKGLQALTQKEPLAIPVGPQSTTYQAIVQAHSESLRTIAPPKERLNSLCRGSLYTHSSMAIIIEEVSSMFREHMEDVINYLITAFDNRDYEYTTKNSGSFYVKNPCLTLIGGTQAAFLQRAFGSQLLNEGFASRVIFVYEEQPRFYRFDFGEATPAKIAARQRVVDHVRSLIGLFGRVELTLECHEYMKHLVEVEWPKKKVNNSEKLIHYYGRKPIHFRKLVLAMHFSESTEMLIQVDTAMRAADMLEKVENRMDMALNLGGRNVLFGLYEKIIKFVKNKGAASSVEIWVNFIAEINSQKELDEALTYLLVSGKLKNKDGMFII